MLITFCKSKIGHATITQAELYYEGSITVDESILKAVDIIPGEKVEVLNLNNGARIETYTIAGMLDTMYQHKGVGLAAPQVGINQQIFVADVGEGPMVVVNPKIIKRKGSGDLEEGCLSIPGITVNVKRSQKITVQYFDENNQ